jgi:hypothetical protein
MLKLNFRYEVHYNQQYESNHNHCSILFDVHMDNQYLYERPIRM